jgi:hypothetical protein
MNSMEKIAVDQADIMHRLIRMNKMLIEELAQYRVMDAEEKELEILISKLGGHNVGSDN